MCVLSDVALSGLFCTSTPSLSRNPLFATNGARSEMLLRRRYRYFRRLKPDSGDTSEMALSLRFSNVRLVKSEIGDISERPLLE